MKKFMLLIFIGLVFNIFLGITYVNANGLIYEALPFDNMYREIAVDVDSVDVSEIGENKYNIVISVIPYEGSLRQLNFYSFRHSPPTFGGNVAYTGMDSQMVDINGTEVEFIGTQINSKLFVMEGTYEGNMYDVEDFKVMVGSVVGHSREYSTREQESIIVLNNIEFELIEFNLNLKEWKYIGANDRYFYFLQEDRDYNELIIRSYNKNTLSFYRTIRVRNGSRNPEFAKVLGNSIILDTYTNGASDGSICAIDVNTGNIIEHYVYGSNFKDRPVGAFRFTYYYGYTNGKLIYANNSYLYYYDIETKHQIFIDLPEKIGPYTVSSNNIKVLDNGVYLHDSDGRWDRDRGYAIGYYDFQNSAWHELGSNFRGAYETHYYDGGASVGNVDYFLIGESYKNEDWYGNIEYIGGPYRFSFYPDRFFYYNNNSIGGFGEKIFTFKFNNQELYYMKTKNMKYEIPAKIYDTSKYQYINNMNHFSIVGSEDSDKTMFLLYDREIGRDGEREYKSYVLKEVQYKPNISLSGPKNNHEFNEDVKTLTFCANVSDRNYDPLTVSLYINGYRVKEETFDDGLFSYEVKFDIDVSSYFDTEKEWYFRVSDGSSSVTSERRKFLRKRTPKFEITSPQQNSIYKGNNYPSFKTRVYDLGYEALKVELQYRDPQQGWTSINTYNNVINNNILTYNFNAEFFDTFPLFTPLNFRYKALDFYSSVISIRREVSLKLDVYEPVDGQTVINQNIPFKIEIIKD